MVKAKKSDFRKNRNTKGRRANSARPKKINALTAYGQNRGLHLTYVSRL